MPNSGLSVPVEASLTAALRSRAKSLVVVLAMCGMGAVPMAVTAGDYVAQARELLQSGDPRAAMIQLKNALQDDPKNAQARLLLGQIYLRAGNGEAAEKELRHARAAGMPAESWIADMGRAYLLQGRFQDVLDEIKADPNAEPKAAANAMGLQALAYLGLQQIDKALVKTDEALALDPQNVEAMGTRARIHLGKGDATAAESEIQRALTIDAKRADLWVMLGEAQRLRGDLKASELAFDKSLAVEPGNVAGLLGRAAVYVANGKQDAAKADADTILKYRPNHPQATYLLALIAFQNQDMQSAQDRLLEVLRVAPTHMPSHLLIGSVYYSLDQLVLAEEHLSKFVASVPDNIPALKLLTAAQMKLGRAKDAVASLERAVAQAPDDAQLVALFGSALLQARDVERGNEMLARAAELDPGMAAIKAQLALGELAAGKIDSAVANLRAAADIGSGMTQADTLLIMTLLQSKRFDEAIEAAKNLATKTPDSPLPENLMGVGELGKENPVAARQHFLRALEIDPAFTTAALNLAELDIRAGEPGAAEGRYKAILDREPAHLGTLLSYARLHDSRKEYDQSLALVERAQEGNPTALQPMLLLARHYLRQGDKTKALSMSRKLSDKFPDNPTAIMMVAAVASGTDDIRGAIAQLEHLVELQPDSPQAHQLLGAELIKDRQYGKAELSLDEALRIDRDYLPAIMAKGQIAILESRTDDAVKLARHVQSLSPDSPVGFGLEADVHARAGDFVNAGQLYSAAYQKSPSSAFALEAFRNYRNAKELQPAYGILKAWIADNPDDFATRMVLAIAYHEDGNFEDAIREYALVTEKDADNVVVLNNLAWLSYQQGKPGGGVEYARRAYELLPERPEIIDTYGWLLVNQNQLERGLEMLQKAVTLAPHRPDMRYHLAFALSKMGRNDDAMVHLTRALRADKPFDEQDAAKALQVQILSGGG